MATGNRKVRTGRVVGDKMDKTVVVAVRWQQRHRLYSKSLRRVAKFYAHDEDNRCRLGDLVRIGETRPISRMKHWRVLEIVERREVAELKPIELDEGLLSEEMDRREESSEKTIIQAKSSEEMSTEEEPSEETSTEEEPSEETSTEEEPSEETSTEEEPSEETSTEEEPSEGTGTEEDSSEETSPEEESSEETSTEEESTEETKTEEESSKEEDQR